MTRLQKALLRSLSVISVLSSPAFAALCVIPPSCADDQRCDHEELQLEWSDDIPELVVLDGVSVQIKRIGAGAVLDTIQTDERTLQLSAQTPVLLIAGPELAGSIVKTDANGRISVTIIMGPSKRENGGGASATRRTYQGHCEGLL
ncbi:hypothetical protein [Roseobacter sp. A03A-229]